MRKIYKYEVSTGGAGTIIKGYITKLLTVQYQPGVGIVLWAEVNDECKEIETMIVSQGTGWEIPEYLDMWDYIGTVQDEYGYVWHYYAKPFYNPDNKKLLDYATSFFGGLTMEGKQPTISNEEVNRIVDAWNTIPN